ARPRPHGLRGRSRPDDTASVAARSRRLAGFGEDRGAERQPPIWLIVFDGLTKSAWPILWPSSFCQTAAATKSRICSSDAPLRKRALTSCSWIENRQVRRWPSLVSRIRLQTLQKASLTDGMTPIPPWLPSRNRNRVAGAGR